MKAFFDVASPVEGSSFISAIGYLPEPKVLVVAFKSAPNSINAYHGVPPETWDALSASPSKGGAFIKLVRNTGFKVTIHHRAESGASSQGETEPK